MVGTGRLWLLPTAHSRGLHCCRSGRRAGYPCPAGRRSRPGPRQPVRAHPSNGGGGIREYERGPGAGAGRGGAGIPGQAG